MRIAFDAGDILKTNGIGVYSRGLIKALAGLYPGDEFHLITNDIDGAEIAKRYAGTENIIVNTALSHERKFGNVFKELVKVINRRRLGNIAGTFDLVHLPNQFRQLNGISNLIVTVHDLIPLEDGEPKGNKGKYHQKIKNHIMNSRGIFVPTNHVKHEFGKYFTCNPEQIIVTYEGADEEINKIQLRDKNINIELTGRYFLHVSRLYKRKNTAGIVKAFSGLSADFGDIRLVLVINGTKNERIEFFKQCGDAFNEGKIVILEKISNTELSALYSNAAGLVFPSFSEGFGLPVLEAMKCGCPVITSNTSCLPEVAGDAALFVNPEDISDIRAAMELLLTNAGTRDRLINKGFERASVLTWDNAAKLTYEGYQKAVKSRGRCHE